MNLREVESTHRNYTGFKYMPLMAITFIPLSSMNESGLILTNLLLYILVSFMVYFLAYQIISSHMISLFALFLYLSNSLIPNEIFKSGVTDLAPVLYLLLGLGCFELNPLFVGIFVGLSISTKLLPGILFVSLCLPSVKRSNYFTGLIIGLFPILYFLRQSPIAFIENVFIFNTTRPTDTTSWLHYFSPEIGIVTRFSVLTLLLSLAIYICFMKPGLLVRCELAVISIFCTLLSGPINHKNYQIWWIPILAAVLSVEAFKYIEILNKYNVFQRIKLSED
jgi:uncharacterized membrane protein